jgi:hypothetical protein
MQLDWLKLQNLAKTTPMTTSGIIAYGVCVQAMTIVSDGFQKLIAMRNVKADKWLWVHKDFQK